MKSCVRWITATPFRVLALVWIAFTARGLFYCVQAPMWEGYDEWAHFAYIQHLVDEGRLPTRGDKISNEIRASLSLVPLPYGLRDLNVPHVSHDDFWRLSREERTARKQQLDAVPINISPQAGNSVTLYEAQQPPLYYMLLSLPYQAVRHLTLPARVLLLRILSMLIASLVIPLGYATACRVIGRHAALMVPILIALMPAFLIDVCRIGNDCLAMIFVSGLIQVALLLIRRAADWRWWLLSGLLLGAGLLTKAYVLAFVPFLVFAGVIRVLRVGRIKQFVAGLTLALSLAAAIGGWWYWRTWRLTGTLSGEQVDASVARVSTLEKLAATRKVDWVVAADELAYFHIWGGAWSFSAVRSWMYRVFELIALSAALGLGSLAVRMIVRSISRRNIGPLGAQLAVLAGAYVLFCAGLAYHVVVVFLAKGFSATCGWYLYAVVVPEVVLIAFGLESLLGRRSFKAAAACGSLITAALDLYTANFILVPYYTGMIQHRPSGCLAAFHLSDLQRLGLWEVLQRIALNAPAAVGPATVALVWIASFCATAFVVTAAFMLATQGPQPPQCCDVVSVGLQVRVARQTHKTKRWYIARPLNAFACSLTWRSDPAA